MDTRRSIPGIHIVARLCISSIAVLSFMALLAPQVFASGGGNSDESGIGSFNHVFVIMMENTGYSSLIGNPNAPWINKAAATYGLATNYDGVTHPSQPNYIAATSGSTQGVTADTDVTLNVTNIVDQLEAHGKTWSAYMQSLWLGGNTNKLIDSNGNQLYERKHDPFVSYLDVQNSPQRLKNIVGLARFQEDLENNTVPDFSWISPDQCHDMHGRSGPSTDACNYNNVQGLITAGDNFLRTTVYQITHSKAWTGNSAIFITWDESGYPFSDVSGCCDAVPGGGRVVTLVISHNEDEAVTSPVAYNHYSILATIEKSWHLGCLGFTCDTANVPNMNALLDD